MSPIEKFSQWLQDYLAIAKSEDVPMVLSTVDAYGRPDSRVVLLKECADGKFVFYTNYNSAKGQQIAQCNFVALNFYWPMLARQVRIQGVAHLVDAAKSDEYFASRPYLSQISAIISQQSQVITSLDALNIAFAQAQQQPDLKRPDHWGGYAVTPHIIEFWQQGEHRLHDRIQYKHVRLNVWEQQRLAP